MKKYLLLLALVCLLGNRALAQEYQFLGTIDFTGLNFESHWQLAGVSSNNNTLESVSEQNRSFVIDENNRHISVKLDDTANGWSIWKSDATNSTYLQKYDDNPRSLFIDGLKQGDKIKIYTEGGVYNNNLRYYQIYSRNTDVSLNRDYNFECWEYTSQDIKIVNNDNNGTVDIRLYGQYSGIHKIEVWENIDKQTAQGEKNFDYDPGYEEYDMYDEFSYKNTTVNNSNGQPYTTYSTSDAGFSLNGQTAQYITLSNSKITANNRIAFDQSGQWRFNFGIRPPNDNNQNWSNFSICNLREGDRVVLSYTGEAPIFSSVGGADPLSNPTYNGCMAFADKYNDGVFNDGDVYITPGASVIEDWRRGEGAIYKEDQKHINNNNNQQLRGDAQLIYTRTYTITEDGHLDFAIKNAPGTRIVKFKIYSDHQAMMVDRPESEPFTNTSYYNITGELQAKEHIVPGGLEVHVGSDNASQHAHVVSSLEGPVSIINGVDGFKLPGMSGSIGNLQFEFDLANNIPETGTFYKFMPLEDGKITLKFQATSMNYYSYSLKGDAVYYGHSESYTDNSGWTEQFDRPNEQTVDVSCPYYLVKEAINGTKTFTLIGTYLNGTYPPAYTIDEAKAGETYYLYGGWNTTSNKNQNLYFNGSGQGLNNLEYFPYGEGNGGNTQSDGSIIAPACGVAKLFEVTFEADKGIYPLAKWVPNGTKAVKTGSGVPNPDTFETEYELATVKGYNDNDITIKKVSGNINIDNIHPFISNGKLMIDGIDFIANKNKGGTILIKIGSPSVKTDPVYALTIAYSADPIYDDEQNELSEEDEQYEKIRGHVWDYSSNSLKGLTWNGGVGTAQPTDYGHYFADYFAADISNYSSKDEVLGSLEPSGVGLLTQEMSNGNTDWMFNYNLVYGGKLYDPVFTNKYDVDGDNADMIWDTEGTVIKASSNQSCIFNEFKGADIHASANDPDRYVGIFEGGEFRIPWLMPNDRVIIWMGTGKGRTNDQAVFNIRGAYDAMHKPISEEDEYIVGGSQWQKDNDKTVENEYGYFGCYHFYAQGHDGDPADMVFKMTGGSMCKIYKIQIYRGDRIITNDLVPVDGSPLYLLTEKGSEESIQGTYSIQYRGKGESISEPEMAGMTGNLTANDATLASLNDENTSVKFTTSTLKDKFGVFNMRLNDLERNNKYVADFADRNFPVDYYEKMPHPYTWDFTDVNRFNTTYLASENSKYSADDLNIWDAETNFTWKRDDELLFVPGGQIYADAQMIAEAAGIQFTPINMGNGTIKATNDGLRIEGGDLNENDVNALSIENITGGSYDIGSDKQKAIWEDPSGSPERTGWKLTIPNLPNLTAVYIRVQTIEGKDPKLTFDFSRGSGTVGSWSFFKKTINNNDGTKDIIVGLSPSLGGSDMAYNIFLNNVIVKKIATSKDLKPAFGKTGYQTESRHREIDHRLTGFFTGEDIEAFYGTLGTNDNGEQVVVLHHLDIMDKADPDYSGDGISVPEGSTYKDVYEEGYQDMEGKGCILYHSKGVYVESDDRYDRSFGILDGGFHLFVPDMHDMDATTGEDDLGGPDNISSNILWARFYNADTWGRFDRFKPGIAETSGNYINFGLSASHYNRSDEIEKGNGYDVGFYHVASKGAEMATHSAYLRMGAGTTSQSKIFFTFDEFFQENQGIATQIDSAPENAASKQKGAFYTLSGVQVNKPEKKGLYIQNGKKVIVK